MAHTKDEMFMLKLYEKSIEEAGGEIDEGGDDYPEFDPYQIGQLVGLQKKAVETICVLLGQANFIKKNDDLIYITPQGLRLIRQLHDENKR